MVAKFHDAGDAISNNTEESTWNLGGLPKRSYITTDIYTSFVLLVGIFFPSCTGKCDLKILTFSCQTNQTYFGFGNHPALEIVEENGKIDLLNLPSTHYYSMGLSRTEKPFAHHYAK